MDEQILFQEKQYLGRDWTWISVRLILALFCFVAYYINWEHVVSQQLFFIVGVGILLVSIIMLYMVSYRTTVTKTQCYFKWSMDNEFSENRLKLYQAYRKEEILQFLF
ncbi:hypothetical protein [Sphingobacterium daejeonense]|uniref:hypothetical protein n=1 Tax=Sphingobacterium daejeonense TaxID=371142 RepID=UPI0010C44F80|nr:hypothetical protein [Sphingobacterium daejeonense]VTP89713.1 Uncharacterised protein [Sphingobacterium daejeonense]